MTIGKPLVIDIYSGDQVQDFARTKAFGILGVIHKATEGATFTDKLYAARRKAWLADGKVALAPPGGAAGAGAAEEVAPRWGAYHFFHGGDPVAEADHFLAVAEPDADTLLALDWEDVPRASRSDAPQARVFGAQNANQARVFGAPNAIKARAFLERVEEKLGRKAVIYSGNVAKEEIRGHDAYFAAHRLWLAQYGTRWSVQPSWSLPWLWQNNGDTSGPGPHSIPGLHGLCDNNTIVNGTAHDLIAGWAG
jgi:GH25 family lysozyme M1 (1,4-beta-N-acetylmuramidase)